MGLLSLNVGINIGGLIGLQTLDNVLASQNASNNENTIRRQPQYQVSLPDVQQQPITIGHQYSGLQQPQQQSLEQLQPLLQKTLQLTIQIQQILQQLDPLLQQSSQLTQTQPSFTFDNTTSLLDDSTNSKGKLIDKSRKTKETIFDITEENDFIEVTVDMRSFTKQKHIITDVYNDDQLILSDPAKTYKVEIMLPSKIVSEPVNKIYKNGILTLKFEKLR
jgi:HSP20 family molecular chaperone IbpA